MVLYTQTIKGLVIGIVIGIVGVLIFICIVQSKYIGELQAMIKFQAEEVAMIATMNDRLLDIQSKFAFRR